MSSTPTNRQPRLPTAREKALRRASPPPLTPPRRRRFTQIVGPAPRCARRLCLPSRLCRDGDGSRRLQFGILERQPLDADVTAVDLYPRIATPTFGIDDNAEAKPGMFYTLPDAPSRALCGGVAPRKLAIGRRRCAGATPPR